MSFNYPLWAEVNVECAKGKTLWAEVNVECAKGKTGTIAASRPS